MRNESRIFLVLSILLAISDCIFVGINYVSGKAALENNFQQIGDKIKTSYDQAVSATEIRMLQIATFTAANADVQNLFFAGKKAVDAEGGGPGGTKANEIRKKLFNKVQSSRDALAESFDFRQLHFHLGPGSLSFLRAHRPKKFGDRMDTVRHTVVTVNKQKEAVTGFETGRVYSGIRGVVPVYAIDGDTERKKFVGALEAGTAFNVTINELSKLQNVEMAVLLTVDHLKENVWPDFLDELSKKNPPISEYFIEATTNPEISKLLRMNLFDSSNLLEQKFAQTYYNNQCYSIISFPLRDFIGSLEPDRPNVGIVVAWRNVQKEVDEFWKNQKINITYGLLGYILIESLLFLGLRASTKKLRQLIDDAKLEILTREQLLKEAQSIGKLGHWELNCATGQIDWSDEIYRIFGKEPQDFKPTYELFLNMVHPDDRTMVDQKFQEAVKNKSEYRVEHRLLLEDGAEKWVLEKGYTGYDEDGKPVRSIGTLQDITEVKLLRGILPICSHCKKIRNDEGSYEQIESYVHKHSGADFSHTICPACLKEHYPDFTLPG